MTLHTKYRPSKFEDVIGQDAAVKAFRSALKKSSRAFLFVGPSGTGKTTLARIGASGVGCRDKDIKEIDAATHTGIDAMREITEMLNYRPLGGGKRTVIIDECHMLSKPAWNSLLKGLEEPPEWMHWFLCTTEVGKVPETVRTRCARFELKHLGRDDLFDLLKGIAATENFKTSESVLDLCVKEAYGSPRQAIVNLGMCGHLTEKADAAELLRSAEATPEAIELARALLDGQPWNIMSNLLSEMQEMNPESVRHVVRAYLTKVILSAKTPKRAGRAMEILDRFSTPFPHGDGISPIVMACGRVVFKSD